MSEINVSKNELAKMSKESVIALYEQLIQSFNLITSQLEKAEKQNENLLKQVSILREEVAVLTQQRFGRKTEKKSSITYDQLSLFDNALNEAEAITENLYVPEPDEEMVLVRKKKQKGKRAEDLKDIETVIDEHYLSEEVLNKHFPNGYYTLPDEQYTDIEYIPAKFLAHEHHIGVYAGKHDEGIIKGDRPERLIKNSLLTPSLWAAIFNGKYVNAAPLNRISEELKRNGIILARQVMANWMITISERYLYPVYDRLHEELLKGKLIHCDETPFRVLDGRGANTKSYMWVYHTSESYGSPPIYLYEYQPTRKADSPRSFLSGYKGILMTDGYQVYHTIAGERPDELKVSGCWAHAKRRFAEIIKAVGDSGPGGTVAKEANDRIAAFYHLDNMYKDKSLEERLKNRQTSIKPLVDEYFAWAKTTIEQMDEGSKTFNALQYSINQEEFLRAFLDDPIIPLDNNDAEISIRKFCIGKHNWHIIDSINGAKQSGVLYSIAETAKANNLNPYYYAKYLLEEILKHLDESPKDYIDNLMPWSEQVQAACKSLK